MKEVGIGRELGHKWVSNQNRLVVHLQNKEGKRGIRVVLQTGSEIRDHHIQERVRHMGYIENEKSKRASNELVGKIDKLVAGWPGVIDLYKVIASSRPGPHESSMM